jgi:SAM-dependent methyltransferase
MRRTSRPARTGARCGSAMAACCSTFEHAAEHQFNEKKAAAEMARYRMKGPGPTTRLLLDGIAQVASSNGILLDIGSGIGALTFGLLDRSVARAVAVDASSAYIEAARQEAERIGRADAVEFVHADFLSVASNLPAATIVALDRVVCCYPSSKSLLNAALPRAEDCLALSYPRDVWYVRLGVMLENGQRRLAKNPFRTFVHPVAPMEEMIRKGGFDLSKRTETWMWSVDVYTRRHGRAGASASS